MTELVVMDADGEEELGTLEVSATDSGTLLEALERSMYLDVADGCTVTHGPDGSFYISDEYGERVLVLEDPANLVEDDEVDEDDEEDEVEAPEDEDD